MMLTQMVVLIQVIRLPISDKSNHTAQYVDNNGFDLDLHAELQISNGLDSLQYEICDSGSSEFIM